MNHCSSSHLMAIPKGILIAPKGAVGKGPCNNIPQNPQYSEGAHLIIFPKGTPPGAALEVRVASSGCGARPCNPPYWVWINLQRWGILKFLKNSWHSCCFCYSYRSICGQKSQVRVCQWMSTQLNYNWSEGGGNVMTWYVCRRHSWPGGVGKNDNTLLPETGQPGLNQRLTAASTADLSAEGIGDLVEWETMTLFCFQRLVKQAVEWWVLRFLL